MSNTPSDEELTACYREANGEMHGKAQPLTTQRIFRAMRAAIVKWGTPQPSDCTRSHPHEDMSDYCLLRTEIARLANENARLKASQPVVREPLTDEQIDDLIATKHFRKGYELTASDKVCINWCRLGLRDGERAHGIKGGQHGTE